MWKGEGRRRGEGVVMKVGEQWAVRLVRIRRTIPNSDLKDTAHLPLCLSSTSSHHHPNNLNPRKTIDGWIPGKKTLRCWGGGDVVVSVRRVCG